jgi:DnaJ-class molecular chaperone
MGNNGAGFSAPGDLYVEIDILSHPLYKRDGLNLTTEYTLNLAEAIRGGTILVPTINGEKITMKVPPNVRPGATIICARGHGIRSTMRTEQGDLYIRLCLKLPESLTSRAAKLIEELVDELEHKS